MTKLLRVLLLLPLFVLGACGGGAADGESGPTKPINSIWSLDGANFTLDLTQITVGNTHPLTYSTGCATNISFRGNEFGGIYSQTVTNNLCELPNGDVLSGAFAINENNVLTIVITHYNGRLLTPELIETYR